MKVSSTMIDKISQLSPERFFIISTLLDELTDKNKSTEVKKELA